MKYLIKIILLFILITPKYSVAQTSDACSQLTRQQIIDSIKVHPNLKYDLKFKCFKKLNLNDIDNIYGENDSLKLIIGSYKSKHKLTTAGIVMMSLSVLDFITFLIMVKHAESVDGTSIFVVGDLAPVLAVGGFFTYLSGDKKKDIYEALQEYHKTHQVR